MRFEPLLPWWVLTAMLAPLLVRFVFLAVRTFKAPALYRRWRNLGIHGLLLVLLICAGSGPSIPGDRSPAGMINLDVVIAIDRTASMSAEDYNGVLPRLDGVKRDATLLVNELRGARICIITFGATAQIILPYTSDTTSILQAINVLDQEVALYANGSSIDKPLNTVTSQLESSERDYPTRGRLFFYFGDGEQTAQQQPRSFASISPLINGGGVLGYGTDTGGRMAIRYRFTTDDANAQAPNEYIKDLSSPTETGYRDAISRYNQPNLTRIAKDMGVDFHHRVSTSQPIDEVVDASQAHRIADTHREVLHYVNLYWLFSWGAGALLLWWACLLYPLLAHHAKKSGSGL